MDPDHQRLLQLHHAQYGLLGAAQRPGPVDELTALQIRALIGGAQPQAWLGRRTDPGCLGAGRRGARHQQGLHVFPVGIGLDFGRDLPGGQVTQHAAHQDLAARGVFHTAAQGQGVEQLTRRRHSVSMGVCRSGHKQRVYRRACCGRPRLDGAARCSPFSGTVDVLRVVEQPLMGHGRKCSLRVRDALPLQGVVVPSVLKFLADASAPTYARARTSNSGT